MVLAVAVVASVTALAAACGSSTPGVTTGPTSTVPPNDSNVLLARTGSPGPIPRAADLSAAARGEQAFGLALYGLVASRPGNLAIAPTSIATVLGMVAAGAKGATETQLVDALRIPLPAARLQPAIGGLVRTLATRSTDGVSLSEVDQTWVQQELHLLAGFTGTLTRDYAAPLARIDFGDPQRAADTINAWTSARTHAKIPKLLTPAALDAAELVLTDAVYLDAKWEHGFDAGLTDAQPFHLVNGQAVSVPTMHQTDELATGQGDGWTAVALPYKGGALEMDVVMPDDIEQFQHNLDSAGFDRIIGSLHPAEVDLSLPRFEFRARFDNLQPELEKLGVKDAFDSARADFSGMTGDRSLFLSAVVHEAFVHVDEQGTVAAAATGGVMEKASAPIATAVRIDKPFLFAVRDRVTGAIVFLGRVADPRAR